MGSRSYQKLLIGILVLIVGGVIFSIIYSNQQMSEWQSQRQAGQQENPDGKLADDVVGEGVSFTITEGDKKRWELKVNQTVYDQDQEWARLKKVSGLFYGDDGEVVAEFESPTGDFNQKKKKIILKDGVVVHSVPKKKSDPVSVLKAPEVTWGSDMDFVLADGGIRLTTEGFGESKARRCKFSMDFTDIRLEGGVDSNFMSP